MSVSRRYLATLALAAFAILSVGLLIRRRLLPTDRSPATPPSEASALQQLTQEGQLRRMSQFLAERVSAVAPQVEYRPEAGAAGVRWGGDIVLSTLPGRPLVALRASPADSARPPIIVAAGDSVRRDWVLVVGRRADGQLLSAAGLAGGRLIRRCAGRDVEEYVLGIPLHDHFAGGGLFDVSGRTLGVVVRCAGGVAAIPAREVTRLLADTGSASQRARDAYGLLLAPLDERARSYFAIDSGLLVTEIRRGGPADVAGLRAGDVVVAIDERRVVAAEDIAALDTTAAPAGGHRIARRRANAIATVRLAAPGGESSADAAAANGDLGISFAPAALARGVPVAGIRPGSVAAAAGLRTGDRLLRVGDASVASPVAAQRLLVAPRGGPLFIVFERDSVERGVLVP